MSETGIDSGIRRKGTLTEMLCSRSFYVIINVVMVRVIRFITNGAKASYDGSGEGVMRHRNSPSAIVIWLDKKIEDGDGVYHHGRWGHGDERTMDTNQEEHDAMLCFMPAGVLSYTRAPS